MDDGQPLRRFEDGVPTLRFMTIHGDEAVARLGDWGSKGRSGPGSLLPQVQKDLPGGFHLKDHMRPFNEPQKDQRGPVISAQQHA